MPRGIPSMGVVAALAEVIHRASRADEGTISATGANIVAKAILTSDDPDMWDSIALNIPMEALERVGRVRIEKRGALPGRGDHGETLRPRRYVTDWREAADA